MQRLALAVLAACSYSVAAGAAPLSNRAASPSPDAHATAWIGCVWRKAELRHVWPQTSLHEVGDAPLALVLASLQSHDDELHAFVATFGLDHVPVAGEMLELHGRMDDSVRAWKPAPVHRATVAVVDGSLDIVFPGEQPMTTFFDYEIHGTIANAGDGMLAVTLASSQEPGVFDGSAHVQIPLVQLSGKTRCAFTPAVVTIQRPEVEP